MAQKLYWSGDFAHNNNVVRLCIEINLGGRKEPKIVIHEFIIALATAGYIYVGNPRIMEVRNEKDSLQN